MAKQASWRTFKPTFYMELVENVVKDTEIARQDEWLGQYINSAVGNFVEEWKRTELDPEECDLEEFSNELYQAVQSAVEDVAFKDTARTRMCAIASAIEELLQAAEVPNRVDTNDKTYKITVSVESAPMMRAWANGTKGRGYAEWDDSQRIKNLKDTKMLCNILNIYADVYGLKGLKARYNSNMESFEPATGGYFYLGKLARKAYNKALVTKKRAPHRA